MLKKNTLAFFNFNDKQQEVFSSILLLFARNLNADWEVVNKEKAQVIFVQSKNSITQTQWDKIQAGYPHAILVAYSVNLRYIKTPWKLLTEATRLPQRSALIALLNKITVEGFSVNAKPKKITTSKKVSLLKVVKTNLFVPENYFLSILQKSLKTGHIYRCEFKNEIVIYLLPEQNCYFCATEIDDLKDLFLSAPQEIKVKKLLEEELKQYVAGLKTKALNDLLWHATITTSQGRFMTNHQPDTLVSLKSWPDISLVSKNKSYLEIATCMNHNTADIIEIAKHSQQKLSDVIDFYNACYLLGLISVPEKITLFSKPVFNKLTKLPHTATTGGRVRLQIVA